MFRAIKHVKSAKSNMAILRIATNKPGVSSVSLLSPGIGIHLTEWKPAITPTKSGGIHHSSAYRDGQILVRKQRGTATESFNLGINSIGRTEIEGRLVPLTSILNAAIEYEVGTSQYPVWIECRAKDSPTMSYARVSDWQIPELSSVFGGSFLSLIPALTDINLLIERDEWSLQKPLEPRALNIAAYACYNMVRDPSLELWSEGDLTMWTVYQEATVTQSTLYAESGNYTARIENKGDQGAIYQDITGLDNSSDYEITVSGYVEDIGSNSLGIVIRLSDGGGFSNATDYFITAVGEFESVLSKQPSAQGDMRVSVFALGAGSVVYIDEISLCRFRGNISNGSVVTSTGNNVYINSRHTRANISIVKKYESTFGGYEDHYWESQDALYFFSDVGVAIGDTLYLGVATASEYSAPFDNLVFNLDIAMVGGTYVLEYWSGGSWTQITSVGTVMDHTDALTATGQNTIHWLMPTNWVANTVYGTEAWWVRIRLTAVPSQRPRMVGMPWTIVTPYVEIAADEVGGDIPALAEIEIENVSDNGDDTDANDLRQMASDMVFVGFRKVSRGSNFTPFINLTNSNNHTSISVETVTSLVADSTYPTGLANQHNIVSSADYESGPVVTILGNLIDEYTGVFRAFAILGRESATGTVDVRLRVYINRILDNDPVFTGSSYRIPVTTSRIGALADLGEVELPGIGEARRGDIGKVILVPQALASSTSENLRWVALVLMPVDEWAGKFTNERETASLTGNHNSLGRYDNADLSHRLYLNVDSIGKDDIRAIVRESENDDYVTPWTIETNNRCSIAPKDAVRAWFLTAKYLDASGSRYLFTYTGQVHRIRMFAMERKNRPL